MGQLTIAIISALIATLFSFFLNQVFNKKDSEVYYKNFSSFIDFTDYLFEHRYYRYFAKGITKMQVWAFYAATFLNLCILWLKSDNFTVSCTISVLLICTTLFLAGINKYVYYKYLGVIKGSKEFTINMFFG